jgi:peptide/nickel transport system substrate-binding protein
VGRAVKGKRSRAVGKTRKTTALIVMLGVILAVGGCGGGGKVASGGQPASKRELVIGVDEIPTTLNPALLFDQIPIAIIHLVAGTLFNLSPDGRHVRMGLAASMQQAGDRLVVKLKPGLKFSDGSALTATDVAASFEFYLHDKTNGDATQFASIAKVTAVNDLTVRFDLKYPYPALPFMLAQAEMAILPSQSIKAKGASAEKLYAGAPLPSAGQFRVKSLTKNEIILQANPNYAGSQPSVKTLTFKQIDDPNARLAEVQSGQLDYADAIPPKETGQLSAPVEVRTVQAAFGTNFLQMNNRPDSLLSDVRIRKAISLAVDRNQIDQIAYGGNASPSLGLFAKPSKFYKPFVSPEPDVAGAKKLLVGTKCAHGCALDCVAISGSQTGIDTATVVQQNLKAIGIDVRVQLAPAAVVSDDLNKGNFDLSPTGLYFTDDVPDDTLYWSIGSFLAGFSGYSNPEVKKLIQTAKTTKGSALAAAVGKANAIFERDLPFTPLVGFPAVAASRVPAKLFGTDQTLFYYVG